MASSDASSANPRVGGGTPVAWSSPVPVEVPSNGNAEEAAESKQLESIRSSFKAPAQWVVVAGAILAACAGGTNTISFLSLGVFVSHATGTLTKIGMRLEGVVISDSHLPFELFQATLLILSFVTGSFLCGFLVSKNEVHFGKSMYGVALIGNSALLVTSLIVNEYFPHEKDDVGHLPVACYFAAVACGLQNGMCTSHFGAVVRTTHVTGLFTDFGLTLGRSAFILFRRGCRISLLDIYDREELKIDAQKIRVFVSLAVGFVAGVVLGAVAQQHLGFHAVLIPASITGCAGTVYSIVQYRLKTVLESAEVRRLNNDVEEVEHILERTRNYIEEWKKQPGDHRAAKELEGHMDHALSVLHDVEAGIHDVFEIPPSPASRSVRSSSPASRRKA